MPTRTYRLTAIVRSAELDAVGAALQSYLGREAAIVREPEEIRVTAARAGTDARTLNRDLLSTLRRVERRTTLRAEWTAGDRTERFFDYVPKGVRPSEAGRPPS
jgi:hypothetical protein